MFANVEGSSLFFESAGEGRAIIFLHGLGGTGNVWYGQRSVLRKTHRVITLNLPGSGRSSKHETSYSMQRWAEQVVGLADHLKIDRFTLVGHSMSTILAQKVAGQFPKRVDGVILCGPLTELPEAGKNAFAQRKALVESEGMTAVADLVLEGALTVATREIQGPLAGMCREMLMSNDPKSYAAQCQALLEGSAKAEQTKIACPVLILVGDQDVVTPLANARAISAQAPTASIRIVPATAHLTMAERPEFFNSLILDFMAQLT